jgi:hypothetical protein
VHLKRCRSGLSNLHTDVTKAEITVRHTSRCIGVMVMMEHMKCIKRSETTITQRQRRPYVAPPVQTPSHRTSANQRSQMCRPHPGPQKQARPKVRRCARRWVYVVGGKRRAMIRTCSMADDLARAQASHSRSARVKGIAVAVASELARELTAQRGCSSRRGCSTYEW